MKNIKCGKPKNIIIMMMAGTMIINMTMVMMMLVVMVVMVVVVMIILVVPVEKDHGWVPRHKAITIGLHLKLVVPCFFPSHNIQNRP